MRVERKMRTQTNPSPYYWLNFDLLLLASVHKLNNETTECYHHSPVLAGGIIIW